VHTAKHSITAIVGVTTIPMDVDRMVAEQTVVVVDGRIVQVGPKNDVTTPSGALRIDGAHLYLMPGLADMHVHFQWTRQINERLLTLFVASGVTTVLNMRGEPAHLRLRDDVAQGKILGPAIYTTGPFIGDPYGGPLRMTPGEVAAHVAADKAAGYDFVKLAGDLSRESYEQLLTSGKKEGIRVIGHLPRNLGVEVALDGHQYAIAHGEEYLYAYFYFHRPDGDNDEPIPDVHRKIREIASKTAEAHVSVMPNLVLFKEIGQQAEDVQPLLHRKEVSYLPEGIINWWSPENNSYVQRFTGRALYFRKRYKILEELTKALQDSGARLLTPTPCVLPGFSVRDELEDLVDAGLTPYQALRTATANAGEFLGVKSGTIAVGQRADFILLRANPLEDVRNVSQLAGVIVNGRWLPRNELQRMLDNPARSSH
jgi:hypothetical protein